MSILIQSNLNLVIEESQSIGKLVSTQFKSSDGLSGTTDFDILPAGCTWFKVYTRDRIGALKPLYCIHSDILYLYVIYSWPMGICEVVMYSLYT